MSDLNVPERRGPLWTASMETGITAIDEQHKSLFEMANMLLDAFGTHHPETIDAILKQLISYTLSHFDAEENLMKNLNFQHLENHCEQHELIHKHIIDLWDYRHSIAPEELFECLTDWIINHIADEVCGFRQALAASEPA